MACAEAPIRSAMTFAGPCGRDAAQVIGETRFALSSRTATRARSNTSIAIHTDADNDRHRTRQFELSESSPASSKAIIDAA